jgi:hypothetical protein
MKTATETKCCTVLCVLSVRHSFIVQFARLFYVKYPKIMFDLPSAASQFVTAKSRLMNITDYLQADMQKKE